ncbi:MAG TPA: hypothetical protein HA277_01970 [Methanosphaera sp.]|nr:hypothetical protein [Methanosphaera sp.]HII09019.1 hypothetical protein [Methanosphaera sp.]HIJ15154.1 hypothetical protein [Methanosphaera sp.]
MEYLNSLADPIKSIDEKNIQYLNVLNHPSLVFGNPFNTDKVNFCKYTPEVEKEMIQFGRVVNNSMIYHKTASCGCRIRFKTTSRRLVFKVELKRGYNYKNMVTWNSSGLDIHLVSKDGKYQHKQLIAPQEGYRLYADQIYIPPNSSVCIFLPSYDTIEQMYIGIERGSRIGKFRYPKDKRSPIIFYGNDITQGASATRSGNAFPNIVSRQMNQDIINFSTTMCCRGTIKAAEMIGNLECDSIVIDYSRNASDLDYFKDTHEAFYRKIRQMHPDKKIIIMTSAVFNKSKKYESFDDVIYQTYNNAKKRGENTYILNQKDLFNGDEYDLAAIDGGGYTDYAMFRVADKICELLKS